MILPAKKFDESQEENWQEYKAKCKKNNCEPQNRNNFNQFILCEKKYGFVLCGTYWKWAKRKKDLEPYNPNFP